MKMGHKKGRSAIEMLTMTMIIVVAVAVVLNRILWPNQAK